MISDKIHSDIVISIPLKKLLNMGLTVEEYYFAYMLYKKERHKLDLYIKNVDLNYIKITDRLIDIGLIEFINYDGESPNYNINNLQSTQEFFDLINIRNEPKGADAWIDEWYALWPTGIKSGGYYLKTDKRGVLRKMRNFLLEYPHYDKEIIIKATESYLMDMSLGGYAFAKLAPYFIYKDGLSVLAGECENLEMKEEMQIEDDDYGGEEL